jgi:hypothetical protein
MKKAPPTRSFFISVAAIPRNGEIKPLLARQQA